MNPAVVNASPVIILARSGMLELLPKIVLPVMLPRAVVNEINAGHPRDLAVAAISQSPWLTIVESDAALSPLATWRLGRGETEVLEYARQNPGTVAVLDDKAARRAATMLGIPIIGTLGILVAAAKAGFLPSFMASVEAVKRAGLYVDPATLAQLEAKLRGP